MRKYRKDTFTEVLNDCNDSITVRKWLEELVPDDIKQEIIKRFNEQTGK